MLPLITTMPTSLAVSIGGAECGAKICGIFQYCSDHLSECDECAPVCDNSDHNGHNYDEHLCLLKCRDFLQSQNLMNEMKKYFNSEIHHLRIYLSVTFIILLILLILFFAVNGSKLFKLILTCTSSLKRPKKSAKQIEPVTMANPNTESPKMRKNPRVAQFQLNRASSVFTVTGSEFDQKTVSTPISRHPAEDTLTTTPNNTNSSSTSHNDFSYENRAMQMTPVNEEKPKIETNF